MVDVISSELNVLIVEDSPTQATLLHGALMQKGFRVTVAESGVEALKKLQEEIPAIIISDIEMPLMNGYELCKSVKKNPSFNNIPIILLTNLSDPQDVIRGIECGADSFLTKPFDIHHLISNITDAIKNKKIRKSTEHQFEQVVEVFFEGDQYLLHTNQTQIIDLLLSTYSTAIQKNVELEDVNRKLNGTHKELKKKNEELAHLNQQKNQFLGMAAHDLRNPLCIIQSYCACLSMKVSDKIDRDCLNILSYVQESCLLMSEIINNLLDITIIESGQVKLQSKEVDVVALAKHNMMLNQFLAEKKEIALLLKCDTEIPKINCDSSKLDQVLNNLLTNAVKYSHPKSTVVETISLTPHEVIFSVSDKGVGIPDHERETLFEPFAKSSAKSTGGERSVGLGLTIVKKIVNEHGGRIWVESEVGKGSTFYFSLPIGSKK